MAEIEPEALGADERAFLLYMLAENPAQGGVQEVRVAVWFRSALGGCAGRPMPCRPAFRRRTTHRQVDCAVPDGIEGFRDDMHDGVAVPARVGYLQTVLRSFYPPPVAGLAAAFGVEGRPVEHDEHPVGRDAHPVMEAISSSES